MQKANRLHQLSVVCKCLRGGGYSAKWYTNFLDPNLTMKRWRFLHFVIVYKRTFIAYGLWLCVLLLFCATVCLHYQFYCFLRRDDRLSFDKVFFFSLSLFVGRRSLIRPFCSRVHSLAVGFQLFSLWLLLFHCHAYLCTLSAIECSVHYSILFLSVVVVWFVYSEEVNGTRPI